MKNAKYIGFAMLLASNAWAAAPVEDLTNAEHHYYGDAQAHSDADVDDHHSQSNDLLLERRIAKLEMQIENITRLNPSEKIEQLHIKMQSLQGAIEKQLHDMRVLSEQQKQFYQDLDRRLQSAGAESAKTQAQNAVAANTAVETQASSANIDEEQKIYREAFELLKTKQYDAALKAMDSYLLKYPRGQYAVNAYYWTGEIYYLQGKAEEAKEAFGIVAKQFPNTQKMPDAMLKLAIIEIDAGQNTNASKMLKKVQQQYPGTTAAKLAGMRIQELKLSS